MVDSKDFAKYVVKLRKYLPKGQVLRAIEVYKFPIIRFKKRYPIILKIP